MEVILGRWSILSREAKPQVLRLKNGWNMFALFERQSVTVSATHALLFETSTAIGRGDLQKSRYQITS